MVLETSHSIERTDDVSWTSLLAGDLATEPRPMGDRAGSHESPTTAPDASPSPRPPVGVGTETPTAAASGLSGGPRVEAPPPRGELEGALRRMAETRGAPDTGELFQSAALDLRGRERRTSTMPPERPSEAAPADRHEVEPPRPRASAPPAAPFEVGARMDAFFEPPSRARRAADRRTHYVIGVMFAAVALTAASAWWFGDPDRAQDPDRAHGDDSDSTVGISATPPRPAPTAMATLPTSGDVTATASSAIPRPGVLGLSSLVAEKSAQTPAPPPIRRPTEAGLLWIDTESVFDVYVQGVRAGQSGAYLELNCGMRYLRLAKPGSPPPGDSFPMWVGEGKAVLVPCGGVHRVSLNPRP